MAFNLLGQPVERGLVLSCGQCPQDRIPGLHKILGLNRIKGCKAMLWAQNPGRNENRFKMELIGDSGKLLFDTLGMHGLGRDDFDIQNVLRCWAVDKDYHEYEVKDPMFKRALQCCGPYNEEARDRNNGAASVHFILGEVAGLKLLGSAYRKDRPIFWHEPWNAYVVLGWHPSYLVRQGGAKAGWDYYEWRDRMRAVRAAIDHPGRYGYIKAQDYKAVRSLKEFDAMEALIRAEAAAGRRVSVDIEDDKVDGKRRLLMVGFGMGRYLHTKEVNRTAREWNSWQGCARCVVLDHPESDLSARQIQALKDRLKILIEDSSIKKSLQHGNYDSDSMREVEGWNLRGYNYDTQYGTFLRYSFMHKFGLAEQVLRFLPEFQDYKYMMESYLPNGLSTAPLDELILYNCADCDVTRRMDARISPQINAALAEVYVHCGFVIDDMETRGPWLDRINHKEIADRLPGEIEILDWALRRIAGREFDCDSPEQVSWLIYDKLRFKDINGDRGTVKEVLEMLSAMYDHPVFDLVKKRRALGRIRSTYSVAYETSANKYGGQLHTVWWLTGAVTARLRSGKGDRAELEGIINMQNIHGLPLIQNMLVSDPNWREALKYVVR